MLSDGTSYRKAVLCPVCQGEGELFDYTEIVRGESGTKHMKTCRGCAEWGSRGWVLVPAELDDGVLPKLYDGTG